MSTCLNCGDPSTAKLCSYCKTELSALPECDHKAYLQELAHRITHEDFEDAFKKLHAGGAVALEVPPENAIAVKDWLESRTLQFHIGSDGDLVAPAECAECRGECPDCADVPLILHPPVLIDGECPDCKCPDCSDDDGGTDDN